MKHSENISEVSNIISKFGKILISHLCWRRPF